jgi:LacI family transcriptional regulator
MKWRCTMQDIAEAAGVSRMSVSLALRNSPLVSRETGDRLRKLALEMGYTPDPLLQRLTTHLGQRRKRESGLAIAWINAWKDRDAWRRVVPFVTMYVGAERAARQNGFHLEEFWLRQPGMGGKKLSNILYQRGIEHLIVGPLPKGNGHLSLEWEKFSVVAVGYSMVAPQINRVVNHQLHAVRTSIRNLTHLGYRRVGLCIDAEHDARVDHAWTTGLAQHQLNLPAARRVPFYLSEKWSEAAIVEWYERTRPDSILTHYYQLGEILEQAGHPPSKQPLIAMLDWPGGAGHLPGINQHHDEIGKAAVDLVISQVNRNERGLPAFPKALMVEGSWIPGNTAGKRRLPLEK